MGYPYSLNDWADRIHKNAKDHGFWDAANVGSPYGLVISQKLALIHSEVSEALECSREGALMTTFETTHGVETQKPTGFPSELADIIIRTLDLAAFIDCNIEQEILNKMRYNEQRPHMHGKAY